MKKAIYFLLGIAAFAACKQKDAGNGQENENFSKLCDQYYEEGLKLFPLNATYAGDDRYNDLLPNDGSVQFIQETKDYYTKYLDSLKGYDPEKLNENDRLSYDVLKDELQVSLNGLKYHFEYMPFNQMVSLPLTFGQLGSGTGAQPFKTVKDYDNWLKRVSAFSVWADTAIGNFKRECKQELYSQAHWLLKCIPRCTVWW